MSKVVARQTSGTGNILALKWQDFGTACVMDCLLRQILNRTPMAGVVLEAVFIVL